MAPAAMASSTLVARDAASMNLGAAGAQLVAVAIIVSTLGANNGIVLTSARIPYAMAREGVLPRWLGGVHARFLTPVPSLLLQAGISCVLTLTGTYDQLFTYVIFTEFLFYALICGAVIRLRVSEPDLPRPYRAWGYPVTPLVFIAFAAYLVGDTMAERPLAALVAVALLLLGLPVYWMMRRRA